MTKLRVLVVEDSVTVRRRLVELLAGDPDLEVVGEAGDGREAIALCERLRPSVITLDMMMPGVSGLQATEHIMAHYPTPILIVSSSVNRGELLRTYDALAAGAVDVMEKPDGSEPEEVWARRFRASVKLVARISVITHPRGKLSGLRSLQPPDRSVAVARSAGTSLRAIGIGASTGGPAAVQEILRGLPSDFPLPILLVIHIGKQFGGALAEWLAAVTHLPVRVIVDGEPLPPPGRRSLVLMAPPDQHLVLRGGALRAEHGPERHSCRPSVDVLFESMAAELGAAAAGCLLTGMGRDGAAGLLALRRAGAITLAQDEATSIVYGMPQEAVRLGAVQSSLPLGDIAHALDELGRGRPGRGTP